MNSHPLIVHFPIALLVVYAICELIHFKKISTRQFWFYFKAILVIMGSIAILGAIWSGSMVEEMFRGIPEKNAIVPVHATLAGITAIIFAIPATSYLVTWVYLDAREDFLNHHPRIEKFWSAVAPLARWVLNTKISLVLAFLGLASITITGALGGAMVHGIKSDPFIAFIHRLFF